MLNTGCAISMARTVFKGCDFSLTLPTLVNLHFLDYSPSSVYEGVCRGFSLDGHNDNDADHLFMCLFSISMYYWQSVCMSLCMTLSTTLSMSFSLDAITIMILFIFYVPVFHLDVLLVECMFSCFSIL